MEGKARHVVRLAKPKENAAASAKLIHELIAGAKEKIEAKSREAVAVPLIFQRSQLLASLPNSKETLLNELKEKYRNKVKSISKERNQLAQASENSTHLLSTLKARLFVFTNP